MNDGVLFKGKGCGEGDSRSSKAVREAVVDRGFTVQWGAAADPLIGQGPRGSRKSTKFRPILDKIRSKIDKNPSNFGPDHCILQLFAQPKI